MIHSDFERGFIAAEIIKFDDFAALGSEQAVKEAGKMRLEGRDYIVQDGDVCHFQIQRLIGKLLVPDYASGLRSGGMIMIKTPWNIDIVNAPAARELLPKAANGSIDWGGIKLCHLDTGYTDHPVFRDPTLGQTWLLPEEGKNFVEGGPPLDPVDNEVLRGKSFGHGTRTSSVICGEAIDLAEGGRLAIGVAPRLPTVPCRVTSWVVLLSTGSKQGVAQGIRLAIERECQVVSMSLGIPTLFTNGGINAAVDAA